MTLHLTSENISDSSPTPRQRIWIVIIWSIIYVIAIYISQKLKLP